MGLDRRDSTEATTSNDLVLRERGMVKNYHLKKDDVDNFIVNETAIDSANIKQERSLKPSKMSNAEKEFIKNKTGFFAKSEHVECEDKQRAIIFRLGRIRMDAKHPDGLYRGRIKYYPEIDSKPILIPFNCDARMVLPEQEYITGDMKQIKVVVSYEYRILDPVKYFLNVRNALVAIEHLMGAFVRDVIGYHRYEELKKEKRKFEKHLQIKLGEVTLGWGIRVQSIDFVKLDLVNQLKYTFVILEPKPLIAATTTTTTTTSGAGATTTTTTTTSSTATPDCINISF